MKLAFFLTVHEFRSCLIRLNKKVKKERKDGRSGNGFHSLSKRLQACFHSHCKRQVAACFQFRLCGRVSRKLILGVWLPSCLCVSGRVSAGHVGPTRLDPTAAESKPAPPCCHHPSLDASPVPWPQVPHPGQRARGKVGWSFRVRPSPPSTPRTPHTAPTPPPLTPPPPPHPTHPLSRSERGCK